MKNAFNKVGLDHVVLVKVASTAVISKLVGLSKPQTNDAISQAFADGQALRIYRQSPNTRCVRVFVSLKIHLMGSDKVPAKAGPQATRACEPSISSL